MSQSTFKPETILALPDVEARQDAIVEAFNQAIEQEDYTTARHIAELVIGELGSDGIQAYAVAALKAHMWFWLYNYLRKAYSEAEEGSEEEESYWEAILETLWKAKWIVADLANDRSLSKAEIEENNQAIFELYEEFGITDSLFKAYLAQAIEMGDVDAAREHFKQWQALEDENFADCEACQQDSLVEYYHFIGDYAKAAELAEPILNGTMSCGEVPHLTYYAAISSLINLGRIDDAKQQLEKAVALIREEIKQFPHIMSKLIQLYHLLGDEERAISLLKAHQEAISEIATTDLLALLNYLLALAPYNEKAKKSAFELAKDLDERNGNQYYQLKTELMFLSAENIH